MGTLSCFGATGMTYPEFPIHRSMDYTMDLTEKNQIQTWLGIASFMRHLIMKAEEQGRDFYIEDPYSLDEVVIKIAHEESFDKAELEQAIQTKLITTVEMRPKAEFVPMQEIYDPMAALKAYRVVDLRPKDQ